MLWWEVASFALLFNSALGAKLPHGQNNDNFPQEETYNEGFPQGFDIGLPRDEFHSNFKVAAASERMDLIKSLDDIIYDSPYRGPKPTSMAGFLQRNSFNRPARNSNKRPPGINQPPSSDPFSKPSFGSFPSSEVFSRPSRPSQSSPSFTNFSPSADFFSVDFTSDFHNEQREPTKRKPQHTSQHRPNFEHNSAVVPEFSSKPSLSHHERPSRDPSFSSFDAHDDNKPTSFFNPPYLHAHNSESRPKRFQDDFRGEFAHFGNFESPHFDKSVHHRNHENEDIDTPIFTSRHPREPSKRKKPEVRRPSIQLHRFPIPNLSSLLRRGNRNRRDLSSLKDETVSNTEQISELSNNQQENSGIDNGSLIVQESRQQMSVGQRIANLLGLNRRRPQRHNAPRAPNVESQQVQHISHQPIAEFPSHQFNHQLENNFVHPQSFDHHPSPHNTNNVPLHISPIPSIPSKNPHHLNPDHDDFVSHHEFTSKPFDGSHPNIHNKNALKRHPGHVTVPTEHFKAFDESSFMKSFPEMNFYKNFHAPFNTRNVKESIAELEHNQKLSKKSMIPLPNEDTIAAEARVIKVKKRPKIRGAHKIRVRRRPTSYRTFPPPAFKPGPSPPARILAPYNVVKPYPRHRRPRSPKSRRAHRQLDIPVGRSKRSVPLPDSPYAKKESQGFTLDGSVHIFPDFSSIGGFGPFSDAKKESENFIPAFRVPSLNIESIPDAQPNFGPENFPQHQNQNSALDTNAASSPAKENHRSKRDITSDAVEASTAEDLQPIESEQRHRRVGRKGADPLSYVARPRVPRQFFPVFDFSSITPSTPKDDTSRGSDFGSRTHAVSEDHPSARGLTYEDHHEETHEEVFPDSQRFYPSYPKSRHYDGRSKLFPRHHSPFHVRGEYSHGGPFRGHRSGPGAHEAVHRPEFAFPSHHYDHYDNSLLGSGNFEVIQGGTFYGTDDPHLNHHPYDHFLDNAYVVFPGHGHHTSNHVDDFFSNFRDFSEFAVRRRSDDPYGDYGDEGFASELIPRVTLDDMITSESKVDNGVEVNKTKQNKSISKSSPETSNDKEKYLKKAKYQQKKALWKSKSKEKVLLKAQKEERRPRNIQELLEEIDPHPTSLSEQYSSDDSDPLLAVF